MHKDTKLAQALGQHCQQTGAVVPPIHVGTSYVRDDKYQKTQGRAYIRDENPNYDALETLLCDLEGAQDCMVYPSGSAAYSHIFQCLPPRSRVIVQKQIYFGMAE
ncbi:MAG: PLP-dependent transferase, partial [Pseudomonadota bacterium]